MTVWMVILASRDADGGDPRREVFEVTPPPEPGRERVVLTQLVHGIHPSATEVSYDGTTARFADGARRIAASFTIDGRPAADGRPTPPGGAQGTLFDAG